MNFETVKTLKGEFIVILEETKDGAYLCVFSKGEHVILAPTELDHDSFSEYSEDDMRVPLLKSHTHIILRILREGIMIKFSRR